MDRLATHKVWWLIPVGFLGLLMAAILSGNPSYTDYAFAGCFFLIGFYLILFKKDIFISLCILFLPLSITTNLGGGSNLVAPSELMVLILGMVAFVIGISRPFYFKKILYHPLTILLLIDLAWLFVTSLVSDIYLFSIKRVIARTLFLLVFYLLTAQWMIKKENMLKVFYLYALGLMIPIISTEINHSAYNFDPRAVAELCKPFFSEHTIYGACIAYVIPFVLIFAVNAKSFGFKKGTVAFLWILFLLLLIGEFMAFSRAAWLSLGASALMFLFLKLKLKFAHFIFMIIALIGIFIRYQEPLYVMAKDNDNVSSKGEIGEHIKSVSN